MNNDEMNEDKRDQVSAEMEVRIVAWVSGEASAAEAAELAALVAAKPELAAYKGRIEAMRGLAAEAVSRDREPLRLSEPRRSATLREIRAPAKAAGAQTDAAGVPELAAIQRRQRRERQWMLAIAASLTIGLFFSILSPSRLERVALEQKSRKGAGGEYQSKDKMELEAREPAVAPSLDTAEEQREVTLSAPQFDAAPQVTMPAMPASVARMEARQAPPAAIALPEAPADLLAEAGAQDATRPTGTAPSAPEVQGIEVFDMMKVKSATPDNAKQLEPAPAGFHVAEARKSNGPGEAASAESEGATVLSPFTVKEPQDKESYKANSTLAGTRVRTDLNDVSAALSVVTAKFLDDSSATSADDRHGYLPKTEVAVGQAPGAETVATAAAAEPGAEAVAESSSEADATTSGGAAGKAKLAGAGSPSRIEAPGQTENIAYSAKRWDFAEISAAKDPVSTFSLHVSDVSFRLAQAALARGEAPDPGRIRPEEFYNAFDYGDPMPAMAEKISCHTEQSADPVMQQRNLLRIAMRVPETGHGANQPLRLTVLLDTSGSMEREDRAAAVQSAMKVLVSLLGKDDRVTLVGFARRPRLLADQVAGERAGTLLDIIAKTPPEGGTNLEEAIKLGGELAVRQFAAGAQNRVVLLTDGAANLGDADPAHLAGLVESLRQSGIAFDACGVGAGGIDDSMLEALTRKGSGRYYVLDTPAAADGGFARQLAGALHPAAENVKVQVRFNAARVGNYRLIGFENQRLSREDFRNDKVAAAALSGGEAAVALYEVEALAQGDGDLGEVYVRFRDAASGAMVERSWTLPYEPNVPAFDRAAPTMQLAGVAALLAEKLHGGARANAIRLAQLSGVVNGLRTHYAHDAKVRELAAMYEQVRRMRYE